MTPRSDDPDVSPVPVSAAAEAGCEIWDTREELLLASAVKRHGTKSWDSVAMEMHRCASAADARFTPSGCRRHALLLHRRFAPGTENGGGGGGGDEGEDPDAATVDEWVEKLRQLRCDELRHEVEQYDLSIGSLESKVKRLEEERERSISGEDTPAAKKEEENEEAVHATGSPKVMDDDLAGDDLVSGGESGRSCKESNSTDLKRPGPDAGTASASEAGEGDAAAREKDEAAGGESVSVKREEASGESVAESKEADAEKESSDVQSTASPSRRREREGGRGEEVEAEEATPSTSAPAAGLPAAEAEALSAFLDSVRASKSGSVFERRLEGQDDAKYRSTIRRHVDLETIRSKLEAGGSGTRYSSASEFYRDLLLLCTNALVFFPRGSPEHVAAVQTRALVSKHMSASLRKDQPGGTSGKAAAASKKPKVDADVGSLLEKTAPIIVCRKRSSITKAAAAKAEKVEKEETEEEVEEKDVKKKVATKDKTRGLRTNKTRGGLARKPASNQKGRKDKDSESESAAAEEKAKKSDKKGGSGAAAGGVAKKRNAVDFLNRMKQNSGPSTERVSLLETLKLSAAAEQKKSGKESGSGSKRGGKDTPPGRRIGRPPKRAAAPPSPPPSKRARGSGRRGGKK